MTSRRTMDVEFHEAKIDALFAAINQCQRPGAAVGIAVGGRPIYRKGFGLASIELPVVLSPSIRMRIGSTTKHFTALAYLLLCEEGRAGIDDSLVKYLPDLHPVTHQVTMRQLMTNTSGLRDACDLRFQFSGTTGRRTTRADLVDFYRSVGDVNAAPGTAWIYNNGGWVLLTAVIEKITGQTFEEAMRTRLFEPLGLHDTLVRAWDTDFVPNSATPHTRNREGRLERLFWDQDFAGAGTIASTINDMLRWAANMDSHRLGSAATWEAMKAPIMLPNGFPTGYGLGLMSGRYRGLEILHHAGGYTGVGSQLLKVPAAGLDVVVLSNCDDVSCIRLVFDILDAMLPNLAPVEKRSAPVVTGTFRSPTTRRVIRLFEQEGQQIAAIDGLDLPYERDDGGVLWPVIEAAHFRRGVTLIGDAEQPSALHFNDFGVPDELLRVAPIDKPDVAAIVGRYRSEATGTDVTIIETTTGPKLESSGRFGSSEFTLESLTHDAWRATTTGMATPPWATLIFDDAGEGFQFTNFTTRGLPFRRCA